MQNSDKPTTGDDQIKGLGKTVYSIELEDIAAMGLLMAWRARNPGCPDKRQLDEINYSARKFVEGRINVKRARYDLAKSALAGSPE